MSFTDDAGHGESLTSVPTDTVTSVTPQVIGICDRTPQVRDAILSRLPKDRTCQLVTDADLSSITHQLDLVNQWVTSAGNVTEGGRLRGPVQRERFELG